MNNQKKGQERLPGQDRGKTGGQRVEMNRERPGLRNMSATELTSRAGEEVGEEGMSQFANL